MHLTKPNGDIVEIDDPYWIDYWKKQGFVESTKDEITTYRAQKSLAAQQASADDFSESAIFYQSVGPGADGYGMSRDIIKTELFNLGVPLQEQYNNQKVGMLYSYPNQVMQMRTDVRLVMTMFESDKIPEDWPDYLSLADEVIVPSTWCAETFKKSGIDATVVPLGYNSDYFQYIDRPVPVEENDVFTFIHYNSFNIRKGFFEVFKAFNDEFKHNEPVRLILKSTDRKPPIPIIKDIYPNIEVINAELPERDLVRLLGRANCMVYPSMGEGFGITPLEAMATGMPAIVPNAHGISEYFDSDYMLEVKVEKKVPGLYVRFKGQDVGEMVICDVADLRKQMRYAYNNQAKMKELGKSASEYVKKFTYKRTAEKLKTIIEKWQAREVVKRTDTKFLPVVRI